jgi:hypothetical protein
VDYALYFLSTILAAYGCGLLALLLMGLPARVCRGLAACLIGLIFVAPLLIPAEWIQGRAFASLLTVDLAFRLIDLLRRGFQPAASWSERWRFLLPFPYWLVVYPQYQRARRLGTPGRLELSRIVGGAAGVALALILLFAAAGGATLRCSFLVDHVAKLFLFVLVTESAAQLLCGLERLAGFATFPTMRQSFLSRTPAEFWRRYNTRIHAWLHDNVFVPAGGPRRPILGICLVFLVSGLFHEVAFGVATSHWDGYQLAFFLLQIPGILASGRLEQLARRGGLIGKMLAHAVSIVLMAGTSIFFFRGVDRIFPLMYVSQPWLP